MRRLRRWSTEAALRRASVVGHHSLPCFRILSDVSGFLVERPAWAFIHSCRRSDLLQSGARHADDEPPPGIRDLSGARSERLDRDGGCSSCAASGCSHWKYMKYVRRRRGEQLGWRPPLVERRGSASLRMPSAPSAGREVTTADYANLRLMLHYSTTTPTLRGGVPASDRRIDITKTYMCYLGSRYDAGVCDLWYRYDASGRSESLSVSCVTRCHASLGAGAI